MGLNDWDGTRALAMLRERMNRLFEDGQKRSAAAIEAPFAPPTEVYSVDGQLVVTVELPGVAEESLTVEAGGGALTVRGQRAFRGNGAAYHRLERSYGEFQCRIALPADADPTRRKVTLEAGVLTVEIPRTP
jgi:HSP20 family protein